MQELEPLNVVPVKSKEPIAVTLEFGNNYYQARVCALQIYQLI